MAVRNDFTAGEVLAAADLNDTFASKVDYALPVNAQTGTAYTFVAADAEKLTTASNGSAVTLTIPPASSVAWPDNTVLRVVNYGAGAVTIDGGSGVTVTNTSSTIAQYGAAVAIRTGSDAWTVVPFGGGDIPAATVSSPAATGQYTDAGITYDYYTFTSSGTLTVGTAGYADVLIVASGAGGGSGQGGGGGGGGVIAQQVFLDAASYTVTIGAGGAGGDPGANGNYSAIGRLAAVFGGGGGGGNNVRNGRSSAATSGGGSGPNNAIAPDLIGTAQGQTGGNGASNNAGGGGGTSSAGANAVANTSSGNGGGGLSSSLNNTTTTYGGGGGGGASAGTAGSGTDGGGNGGVSGVAGSNGSANRGGGGGGGGASAAGGNGGSGVVIVRVAV